MKLNYYGDFRHEIFSEMLYFTTPNYGVYEKNCLKTQLFLNK